MVRAAPLAATPAEQRDVSPEASDPRRHLVWNLYSGYLPAVASRVSNVSDSKPKTAQLSWVIFRKPAG